MRYGHYRLLSLAAAIIGAITFSSPSAAWTYKLLYTFCKNGGTCLDGKNPVGGLLLDKHGNMYGTTTSGGAAGGGTVFEFSRATSTYNVLYDFCSKKNCDDGATPSSSLIMDKKGNLYGTTTNGGRTVGYSGWGEVFELVHSSNDSAWTLKVLHGFGGGDGGHPYFGALTYAGANTGALYDGKSTLYGTTSGYPAGTQSVFSLARVNNVWTLTTIYNAEDFGGVIFDSAGNLYGTSQEGGDCEGGGGWVYELSPGISWTPTVLHSFGCENDSGGPKDTLLLDSHGNLWGTTYGQPDPTCYAGDCGTVFELTPNGSTWTYQFPPIYLQPDGIAAPTAGLIEAPNGNLYGTASGSASIYEVVPGVGLNVLWTASCGTLKKCRTGTNPVAPLIVDKTGRLFGVMSSGGDRDSSAGTIFELVP